MTRHLTHLRDQKNLNPPYRLRNRNYLISLFIICALLLSGCGSSSSKAQDGYYQADSPAAAYDSYGAVEEAEFDAASSKEYSEESYDGDFGVETGNGEDLSNTSASDQKMIIRWSISLNTEKYEEIMNKLHSDVAAVGGYIENESENIWDDDEHYCDLTIRIPVAELDGWLSGVDTYGVITYRSQSQENATLTYVDVQSRITALRTEQTTLLDLMARADSMEDIIAIQTRLTEVNYEIESYESQLRTLSNSIDYATIYMSVAEVKKEIPMNQTIGEEIRERFDSSLTMIGRFFRNLIVDIAGYSVILLLLAAFIFLIVFLCKLLASKARRKRIAKAVKYNAMKAAAQGEAAITPSETAITPGETAMAQGKTAMAQSETAMAQSETAMAQSETAITPDEAVKPQTAEMMDASKMDIPLENKVTPKKDTPNESTPQ